MGKRECVLSFKIILVFFGKGKLFMGEGKFFLVLVKYFLKIWSVFFFFFIDNKFSGIELENYRGFEEGGVVLIFI